MRPTFSISLHKDAGSSKPITSSNLKLGEVVFFSLTWSNKENQQVEFFAKDCKIIDGDTEVNIISDTCMAGVVETKRYDLNFFITQAVGWESEVSFTLSTFLLVEHILQSTSFKMSPMSNPVHSCKLRHRENVHKYSH